MMKIIYRCLCLFVLMSSLFRLNDANNLSRAYKHSASSVERLNHMQNHRNSVESETIKSQSQPAHHLRHNNNNHHHHHHHSHHQHQIEHQQHQQQQLENLHRQPLPPHRSHLPHQQTNQTNYFTHHRSHLSNDSASSRRLPVNQRQSSFQPKLNLIFEPAPSSSSSRVQSHHHRLAHRTNTVAPSVARPTHRSHVINTTQPKKQSIVEKTVLRSSNSFDASSSKSRNKWPVSTSNRRPSAPATVLNSKLNSAVNDEVRSFYAIFNMSLPNEYSQQLLTTTKQTTTTTTSTTPRTTTMRSTSTELPRKITEIDYNELSYADEPIYDDDNNNGDNNDDLSTVKKRRISSDGKTERNFVNRNHVQSFHRPLERKNDDALLSQPGSNDSRRLVDETTIKTVNDVSQVSETEKKN